MIKRIVVGPLGTNCFVVSCDDGQAAIIDPGSEAGKIRRYIEENNLKPQYIVNTHGHYDHIEVIGALQEVWDIPVYIRSEDVFMYNVDWGQMVGYPFNMIQPKNVQLLDNIQELTLGDLTFNILFTPGHSPGGVCLYIAKEKTLIAGDTLFCDGIGRTDVMGGSYTQMQQSLKMLFDTLPDDTRTLPGHGPETTIGREKANW